MWGENDDSTSLGPELPGFGFSSAIVGLWRSWERASMAWKRSSVRSRPGPPNLRRPCQVPISISFASSPLAALSATESSQRQYVLGDAPAHGTICREKPVFAGKVTCGVRNETSGQSWPSNTVAADPFTGQTRNSKCGSRIQHQRLGGWRPKTLCLPFQTLHYIGMAARGVSSSLPFLPNQPRQRPSAAAMDVGFGACQQLPDCWLANVDR